MSLVTLNWVRVFIPTKRGFSSKESYFSFLRRVVLGCILPKGDSYSSLFYKIHICDWFNLMHHSLLLPLLGYGIIWYQSLYNQNFFARFVHLLPEKVLHVIYLQPS